MLYTAQFKIYGQRNNNTTILVNRPLATKKNYY